MNSHELTMEQQVFAAQNHNIVYAFLRSAKLSRDDYYDVVIFGYLRAVRQYCDRGDLREKYAFSTIAWRKMKDDLAQHNKRQHALSRNMTTVSLEERIFGGDEHMTQADIIPDRDWLAERLESGMFWDKITENLSREQADVLQMRAEGYSTREIAALKKRRTCDVDDMFSEIRASLSSLSLA